MKCPYCGYKESKVIDSRPAEEGSSIRRRRECLSCAKRFTTYETVESLPMVVIKKDGSRQSFDKRKVLNGMIRACEKRPVPFEVLEQKADEIDRKINKALVERFGTDEPGELIDPEKNVRVWYIARFLDGFVQSTNIDEVKRIVYGEVESTGTYMSYTPSLNKDKQILAWYYALPHFRYGSWGALLTVSSNAYGVVGITGTTQTSSSTNYAATYAMMNYYGMMNNYYGNNYMGNYYDDYYGSYMNGLYGGSVYNPYYVDNSTSTSTTITEVLPYTPLLIEFYIEPAQ